MTGQHHEQADPKRQNQPEDQSGPGENVRKESQMPRINAKSHQQSQIEVSTSATFLASPDQAEEK